MKGRKTPSSLGKADKSYKGTSTQVLEVWLDHWPLGKLKTLWPSENKVKGRKAPSSLGKEVFRKNAISPTSVAIATNSKGKMQRTLLKILTT